MLDIILISIFTFFAFYGILHITMDIASGVAQRRFSELARSHTVITVKDRENDVEGIIRSLAWKQLNLASCGTIPELYAVDLGSCDGTYEILERLALEYDFLRVLHKNEYVEAFDNA